MGEPATPFRGLDHLLIDIRADGQVELGICRAGMPLNSGRYVTLEPREIDALIERLELARIAAEPAHV